MHLPKSRLPRDADHAAAGVGPPAKRLGAMSPARRFQQEFGASPERHGIPVCTGTTATAADDGRPSKGDGFVREFLRPCLGCREQPGA